MFPDCIVKFCAYFRQWLKFRCMRARGLVRTLSEYSAG